MTGDFGSSARASLTDMLLPRFHRAVLSLVAGIAATVACLLAGQATSDVVQCVWALSAGISLAVAAAAWWPSGYPAAPRPPAELDVVTIEAAIKRAVDAAVDAARAA